MSWLRFLEPWLPLLILLNIVASALIVLAFRRAAMADAARRARADQERARAEQEDALKWDGVDRRVKVLEETGKLLPTREDLHLLRIEMIDARGELRTAMEIMKGDRQLFSSEIQAAQRHFDNQIQATQNLVDRTEKMATMVVQHLLEREK